MTKRPTSRPHDQEHLTLLDKPLDFVASLLGAPVGEYPHRGKRVVMFQHRDETVTCELVGGMVKSVNSFRDRRSAVRIKQKHHDQAFIRHGRYRHVATIIDLSVKAIAMKIEEGGLPAEAEFVTFCTSLLTRARTRIHVTLSGHVLRVWPDESKIVVMLHVPFETQSHRVLQDYINVQQALLSVGSAAFFEQYCGGAADHEVSIIKSDLCTLCEEGCCGTGHASYTGKAFPRHLGIRDKD